MRISLVIIALLMLIPATARKMRNTTRGRTIQRARTETLSLHRDTLSIDSLHVTGYEKPLRSTRETMFVTNNHATDTLREVTLRITYNTMDGKMLHRRDVTVNVSVPPGERRMASTRSWDTHRVFHYHLNQPVRNLGQATPYTVSIQILSAFAR